ncbi:YdbH domain-containing protein [Shewanella acanthi]|uniref:YdbH domain-containing protein n=1 Tax=Shewanella acanthi TaxID=2864212 RepID=UPI001C654F49|nr:YdbH domain-containing protein [Shewanella acanthi]QYJ80264.1 YdbH domain-containing protein [Shewanella acanthi]
MPKLPTKQDKENAKGEPNPALTSNASHANAPTKLSYGRRVSSQKKTLTSGSNSIINSRLRQTLLATCLLLVLGLTGAAFVVTQHTEALIQKTVNALLKDTDGELIQLGKVELGLRHWHLEAASVRFGDSLFAIQDINIDLQVNLPQDLTALTEFFPLDKLLTIHRVDIDSVDAKLGPSLFIANMSDQSAIGESQTPYHQITHTLQALPEIDITKILFELIPPETTAIAAKIETNNIQVHQKVNVQLEVQQPIGQLPQPRFALILDDLVLRQGEISGRLSQRANEIKLTDIELAKFKANLKGTTLSIDSEIDTGPLLKNLHTLVQLPYPNSILASVVDLDNQWQAQQIEIEGKLKSQISFDFISSNLQSQHQFIEPKMTFSAFEGISLAPKTALNLNLSGPLKQLELQLEPFELSLTPTEAQTQKLLAHLDEESSQTVSFLLNGLRLKQTAITWHLGLQDSFEYPLYGDNSLAKYILPSFILSTQNSKVNVELAISYPKLSLSQDSWQFDGNYRLATLQQTPIDLESLWQNAPLSLAWQESHFKTQGNLTLSQSQHGLDWQLSAKPNVETQTAKPLIELKGVTLRQANSTSVTESQLSLGQLQLTPSATLTLASQRSDIKRPTTSIRANVPPLTLAFTQLAFSQQALMQQTSTLQPETHTASIADFSLQSKQAMGFEELDTKAIFESLNAGTWANQLEWQVRDIQIDKQQTSHGRSRKETLLKLDNLNLKQDLSWKKQTLKGIEHWQLGTFALNSVHQLKFANGQKPLKLSGQWHIDSSLTQTLALLNQLAPLPSEFNATGNNQLKASFELTQSISQTHFAMQINQSITELEGFYQDLTFDGGKLNAQCLFTWGQSLQSPTHRDYFSSVATLKCPNTQLYFSQFDPGFPLTEIEVESDIVLSRDADKVATNYLQQLTGLSDTDVTMTAKGKVLSGHFLLPDFNLRLQDKSHAYLILHGMSLEEVLRIQPQIGVYADGIFDGVLPVDLNDGKVSISGGQLAARPPGGLIAISGSPAVDQMRASQPYLDFVFQALEHLEYSQLSSTFDMDNKGDAILQVEVKGKSRGIERPIHLNYSQEENMLQLLRSLQIGNDLQDRIEKSVK